MRKNKIIISIAIAALTIFGVACMKQKEGATSLTVKENNSSKFEQNINKEGGQVALSESEANSSPEEKSEAESLKGEAEQMNEQSVAKTKEDSVVSNNTTNNSNINPGNAVSQNNSAPLVPSLPKQDNSNSSPVSSKKITLGSTLEEVKDILGEPRSIYDVTKYGHDSYVTYYYEKVTLYLYKKNGTLRVVAWSDCRDPRVSIADKLSAAPPITFGSTMEDVAKAMGTPTDFDPQYSDNADNSKFPTWWKYPSGSTVFFDYNFKVYGWLNEGDLKVNTGAKNPSSSPITLGSTKSDVTKAMGTPRVASIDYHKFVTSWLTYNNSDAFRFDINERVIGWNNTGKSLKVTLGTRNPAAPPVTLGSSLQDVVAAMGTPDILEPGTGDKPYKLVYGKSYIIMSYLEKVMEWDNRGELKVTMGYKDPLAPAFKTGSSIQDVVKAMGTPDRIGTYSLSFYYGNSCVNFSKEGIVSYYDNKGNLKVQN